VCLEINKEKKISFFFFSLYGRFFLKGLFILFGVSIITTNIIRIIIVLIHIILPLIAIIPSSSLLFQLVYFRFFSLHPSRVLEPSFFFLRTSS